MQSRIGTSVRILLAVSLMVVIALLARSVAFADPVTCDDSQNMHIQPGSSTTDLQVTGPCAVPAGTYVYHNVNIFTATGATSGGTLTFADAKIDFYAESIIVEGGGKLTAGTVDTPIGTSGGQLTIHLWGAKADPGATCASTNCGVPDPVWNSNTPSATLRPTSCSPTTSLPPGSVNDCFYKYQALDPADMAANIPAYYGHKVLAVGYNGTIQLFGAKGATYAGRETGCLDSDPSCSGTSWTRLNANALPKASSITVDGMLDWKKGDQIVISSTDFLPSHAEVVTLNSDAAASGGSTTLTIDPETPITWPHNGIKFDLSPKSFPGIQRLGLNITSADTRASVGLLSSRSIRIVSEGDTLPQQVDPTTSTFPPPSSGYFYGGHTIVRQGFLLYQVQGVEFYQLGQGGDIMHYPVHFHMARQTIPTSGTAPVSFVKDCSIWDSMTRWIVIHATQGVKLARNVGYESIGHGYYLEDGTETGNQIYANLGVLARGAVRNSQNPRSVPGILTTEDTSCKAHNTTCATGYDNFPFYSDSNHPAVFWIMNGMNDFQYNMAAGASTCGACYWFVPGGMSGLSLREKWFGYASEQLGRIGTGTVPFSDRAGTTPLQNFLGNSCSSAMEAFMEVGNSAVCEGVNQITYENLTEKQQGTTLQMLWSSQATQNYPPNPSTGTYWPIVSGGGRLTTLCNNANATTDCSTAVICSDAAKDNCDVVVLDKFTTTFNWAQNNFSAIWVRPFWSLVIDSVIGDPLGAGLNFVTSGDYSKASVITGFWALARKSAFIGSTQWQNQQNPALATNPYASSAGPFNPFPLIGGAGQNTLTCAPNLQGNRNNAYCMSQPDGISIQLANFGTFQRLFSVYDGPTYQDSNAYLNIHPSYLTADGTLTGAVIDKPTRCAPSDLDGNPCAFTTFMNAGLSGVRAYFDPFKKNDNNRCFFPNAAIGWKQPNGFYYAPAFHSANLYFNGVDIRHFVTEPLFLKGTLGFKTDEPATKKQWCSWNNQFFTGFTDIDRETVLNDDDGTLTGLTSPIAVPTPSPSPTPTATPTPLPNETISVNNEHFFDAPTETTECASDVAANKTKDAKCPPATARTSPYQYLTAAIYPECALTVPLPPPDVPAPPLRQCAAPNSWGSTGSQPPVKGLPGTTGIPIYRQMLTEGEAVGENQLKRMMGQNSFQRSGLTVDNGMYYIDTNLSNKQQMEAGAESLNTFVANGIYDLYFVYAKANSKQTYLMYVGKDQPENFGATNVKFGYVDITTNVYKFSKAGGGALPPKWSSTYDKDTGILRLVMDMSGLPDDFDLTKGNPNAKPVVPLGQTLCQPASMCTWNNDTVSCSCNPKSPYASLCNQQNPLGQTICSWSVKDLDCPIRGCPSFQITFPGKFEADGASHRPVVVGSPSKAPDLIRFSADPNFKWSVPFGLPNYSDDDVYTDPCQYKQQPGPGSCMTSQ